MTYQTNPHRYAPISIALHWLMLLVIAAVFATIELRGEFPRGSDVREGLKTWHFMLGLSVLALVIVRIGARLKYPAPADPAGTGLTRLLAKAGHLALYLLMIAMPLAGWVILSAEGKAVPFFGLELPPLVGGDKDLAEQVEDLHKLGGTIGYWLIGLHALAALVHHHLLKDGTMTRMLPGRN